ncbi:hypothetical protein CLV62_1024 [Dysgonomonas alginatilytica]|uniref:Uncharacterized protein n=1 Tax=Dysgonomonas alginatilytica TaxID=1605892 RepID=A0A2V3PUK5_9BACT|nr:hypothetical protein CLV62_1024 [Dysgonomonas alginatilytica]
MISSYFCDKVSDLFIDLAGIKTGDSYTDKTSH